MVPPANEVRIIVIFRSDAFKPFTLIVPYLITVLYTLEIKECVKYLQHLLIGQKFTVLLNHKPLENMNIASRTDEELGDLTYYLSLITII